MSLVDTATGEVRSQVIPDVTGATLRKVLSDQVDLAATTLVTDEWQGYKVLRHDVVAHETVTHSADEYVNRRGFITNAVEAYFSQLKRSIDGTHHHVSKEYLHRYLAQLDFMRTHCKETDSWRVHALMAQTRGRRLT